MCELKHQFFTVWFQFEPDSRLNVSIWCWRSTKMSKHMFQAYFEHCRPQSAGDLGDGRSACDHSCSFYQPSSLTYGLLSSALVWCLHYKSVPSKIIALRGNALVAMVTLALHKLTSWRLTLTELLGSVILKVSWNINLLHCLNFLWGRVAFNHSRFHFFLFEWP